MPSLLRMSLNDEAENTRTRGGVSTRWRSTPERGRKVPIFHDFHSSPQKMHRFCALPLSGPRSSVSKECLPQMTPGYSPHGPGLVLSHSGVPRFSTGKCLKSSRTVTPMHLKYKMLGFVLDMHN